MVSIMACSGFKRRFSHYCIKNLQKSFDIQNNSVTLYSLNIAIIVCIPLISIL